MSTYESPYSLWVIISFIGLFCSVAALFVAIIDDDDSRARKWFARSGAAMLCFCIFLGVSIWLQSDDRRAHAPSFVRTDTYTMIVQNYDPPKHFYVDLYDINSKKTYPRISVSKHCNGHRKIQKGVTQLYVRVDTYVDTHGSGEYYSKWRKRDIEDALC